MKTISLATHRAFGLCAAAALLAGCGGSQAPIGLPEAMQQKVPITVRPDNVARPDAAGRPEATGSWMSPQAKNENLFYVSNLGNNSVSVYATGGHKMVGLLTDAHGPYGLCSDNDGNVWIVEWGPSKIVEYAHAGTKPIRTLSDPQGDAYDCSVDPTTGNLAVTNWSGEYEYYKGNVAIYAHAAGQPKLYSGPRIWFYYACAYDDDGNLFANGWEWYLRGFVNVAELHRGAKSFVQVGLYPNNQSEVAGGLQWDGQYLAMAVWGTVYRYAISGGRGIEKGSTELSSGPLGFFWIPRLSMSKSSPPPTAIVASGDGAPDKVRHWKYPEGGPPTLTLTDGLDGPYGVTFSKAKN